MSIFLFFVILIALVVVHEFGHFAVAKWAGIRVDEFGFGFPPKLWGKRLGETEYSFNALPFGGFVRIFGENPEEVEAAGGSPERSFTHKPKTIQTLVLVAGVAMNMLFAWFLLSVGYTIGMPVPGDYEGLGEVRDRHTAIMRVVEHSPAQVAGLASGDTIAAVSSKGEKPEALTPESIQTFIAAHQDDSISFTYEREGAEGEVSITPQAGLVEGKAVVGIEMDEIGTAVVPFYLAPLEGARLTWNATQAITTGLFSFFKNLFMGAASFSEVTGPVGLIGIVGSAASFGLVPLLSLIALISINLAIINLIPFPALDGGRLLFVVIEAIKGSPIRPQIAGTANMIGFALLIVLMLLVTYHDIVRLVI